MKLTLFFDSYCPLCAAEMNQLAALDKHGRLQLEDIHQANFKDKFPHIDPVAADRILHAQYEDGSLIYGLDVTCAAWKAVEKKRWLVVLRWPIIRIFADIAYLFFAKNRYSISWLFTGKRRCESCQIEPAESCDS